MSGYGPPDFARGSVWAVGGGSGQPGYVSLLALHALRQCDTVFYDVDLSKDLLVLAGEADTFPVPHADESVVRQVLARATRGERVVRLYRGDPLFFAAGNELSTLAAGQVPVRVVPGIPTANAALADVGVAATHRDTNSSVCFVRVTADALPPNFDHLAFSAPVLVIETDSTAADTVRGRLLNAGLGADRPMTVLRAGPLAEVIQEANLSGFVAELPSGDYALVLVVGQAKRLAKT